MANIHPDFTCKVHRVCVDWGTHSPTPSLTHSLFAPYSYPLDRTISMENEKSRRPADTPFKQQRMTAWQPVLTPLKVILIFFVIGVVFIPVGVTLLDESNSVRHFLTVTFHISSLYYYCFTVTLFHCFICYLLTVSLQQCLIFVFCSLLHSFDISLFTLMFPECLITWLMEIIFVVILYGLDLREDCGLRWRQRGRVRLCHPEGE